MKTVYTDKHHLRNARTELAGGELVRPFECPERAEIIRARVEERQLGEIVSPGERGLSPVLAVHDEGYVRFLETAWDEWQAEGFKGEAMVACWPARRMTDRRPDHIEGKLGYYAMAAETAISPGTFEAARWSANVALAAADIVLGGERAAFALTRPPGHHAARDMFGGYCFLNNAAIAAQHMRLSGAGKVAILDVDYHHGNGTQDIFYERADVLFASLHADPRVAFPHFSGYADETGMGDGEGATLNRPLPDGTDWTHFSAALADVLDCICKTGTEALVVSLGVDTFERDPISTLKLTSENFLRLGEQIASAGLPTLFVMEGGYAVAEIGINAVNTLEGFEQAA